MPAQAVRARMALRRSLWHRLLRANPFANLTAALLCAPLLTNCGHKAGAPLASLLLRRAHKEESWPSGPRSRLRAGA